MKKLNKYKLIKGDGAGANTNSISIEFITGSEESVNFVGKVRSKAKSLFGEGLSLNSVGTSYGIFFRYRDENKNRKMAKMLIKIVELEEELLKMKNL